MPCPGRFTPRQRDPVPIVQEAGWAPGPVWTSAEHFTPTGIRLPNRPEPVASRYTDAHILVEKGAVSFKYLVHV
jgi:hypothetical protein